MKQLLTIFCLLIVPSLLVAQSNVDKLVATLDSLTLTSLDNWSVSPDLRMMQGVPGDPSQPGYDDTRWETLKLNQSIYPDSCWLRKEFTIPEWYLGKRISGKITFLVSVDDYGYLWVNGESRGHFPWDGTFELTKDAKPGQKFTLAIKAINTGGPLRLLRAEIQTESNSSLRSTIQDFALSLRVGQKLLGFDTYQTNARRKQDPKIDKSTFDRSEKQKLEALLQSLALRLDVNGLAIGDVDRFSRSLADLREKLKPIGDYAKRFTLYFDANAHIDAAWLWRSKETIEVCKNTFSSVFTMMNTRPDFTYTQSSAAYYDWMERLYPEVFRGIQQRVKDGRWELVGGMWVEPDCNLPSGESWNRQLLYGKRYFRNKLGIDVKIGWNPDSFGYNGNMPMFYADAGIDAFITQKIGWNETNVFPHRLFWWESPDGSRILSYFPFDYVNSVDDPFRLIDWTRQFEANTGFTKMLILFGVGDHGGGPSLEMIDRIERLRSLDVFPSIEYGTASTYLGWLKKQDLSSLPVWRDELYLEYHQGTYTTQSAMKNSNRRNEVLLTNAEKYSSFASLLGRKYNAADLEEAWHNVLFNQFHDLLPGSGIREIYIDAAEDYRHASEIGNAELEGALHFIASRVNTATLQKSGEPILVMNPVAWERSDVVSVMLPKGDEHWYGVFNQKGKEIPSQIVRSGKYNRELLFLAKNVPALGYATFQLELRKGFPPPETRPADRAIIENEFYRVAVEPSTGWVNSIVDKRTGKEILAGPGNALQLLEDKPSAWDAWNIGLTGVEFPSTLRSVAIVEQGPVRTVLRTVRDYLKPGVKKDFPTEDFPSTFFTQDIILYNGIDRIDFKTDVDWWEDKTMLKVAFPIAVQDTVATYEIPYGTIRRSTQWRNSWDSAKVEVPTQRWADLSNDEYGVSLLNRSKYGYDIKKNVIRLSLLRSPKWPDPTADRGKHTIEYAIVPHQGRLAVPAMIRRGYEYNAPLLAVFGSRQQGDQPMAQSFVEMKNPVLILTSVKKAEEDDAIVLQWYNPTDVAQEAAIALCKAPHKIVRSTLMEEDGTALPVQGKTLRVPTRPHALVTVKVWF